VPISIDPPRLTAFQDRVSRRDVATRWHHDSDEEKWQNHAPAAWACHGLSSPADPDFVILVLGRIEVSADGARTGQRGQRSPRSQCRLAHGHGTVIRHGQWGSGNTCRARRRPCRAPVDNSSPPRLPRLRLHRPWHLRQAERGGLPCVIKCIAMYLLSRRAAPELSSETVKPST